MLVLSKGKAKFVRSLQHQKYRQKYHKIIVEGVKILNELISSELATIHEIYASDSWFEENGRELPNEILKIEVNKQELSTISSFKNPQDCLAVVEMPANPAMPDSIGKRLCLYLDAVRDPGNLGTLIRSADWFGFEEVFLSPDCVDMFNPKVIQSSMASVFRVKHKYIGLEELLSDDSEAIVFGALLGAPVLSASAISSHGLIVLGNESNGIRHEYRERISRPFSISAAQSLGAESLNVGVAGGIICSMFRAI